MTKTPPTSKSGSGNVLSKTSNSGKSGGKVTTQAPSASSTAAAVVQNERLKKNGLFFLLDKAILQKELTELHTHLMGMGSADLWVSKIIENYIPRIELHEQSTPRVRKKDKVIYPLKDVLQASGFASTGPEAPLDESLFEAVFFDGLAKRNLKSAFKERNNKGEPCISNQTIADMLDEEDAFSQRKGPLRALVRNWFEFLGSDGQSVTHSEVLQTYRGQFTPGFCPRRFVMKDPIVNARPEVLAILLNSTCARYAKAGVNYIEYSVSCGDLLSEKKFQAMRTKTFGSPLFGRPWPRKETPSREYLVDLAPTLPKPQAMVKPRPSWRKFVDYKEKPRDQKFTFLAAFSRDKRRKPAKKAGDTVVGIVYCQIQMGEWQEQDVQPKGSREAYHELGKIASNSAAIAEFLANNGPIEEGEDPQSEVTAVEPELVDHNKKCKELRTLAKVLCRDEHIQKVYPYLVSNLIEDGVESLAAIDQLRHKLQQAKTLPTGMEKTDKMIQACEPYVRAVVGLDWVGDELGHPFCIFSHDKFVSLVAEWMTVNDHFGVRIHAGEGPIRPSTREPLVSELRLAFYLHMYILTEGIKLYHGKLSNILKNNPPSTAVLKPRIRIGHGVAFLWGCEKKDELGNEIAEFTQFDRDMDDFRGFLRMNRIVCELNPTSNHMLLPSTFHGGDLQNQRTLPCFLREELPVVLATDDDGIWAIHKCKRHYHHVSVAAEYCQAIERGDITSEHQLKSMLGWGRQCAFSGAFTAPLRSTSRTAPASALTISATTTGAFTANDVLGAAFPVRDAIDNEEMEQNTEAGQEPSCYDEDEEEEEDDMDD